jgi:hypothetical protein
MGQRLLPVRRPERAAPPVHRSATSVAAPAHTRRSAGRWFTSSREDSVEGPSNSYVEGPSPVVALDCWRSTGGARLMALDAPPGDPP